MHERICVCDQVPTLQTRTRLTLILHYREQHQTSNTGHLLNLALPNSEVRIYGDFDNPLPTAGLAPETHQTYVLFPGPEARELTLEEVRRDGRPVNLVVPDGTWRQSSRMMRRCEPLRQLPARILPPGPPSAYQLRRAEQPERISTFEAGARALGLLEGAQVQQPLEMFFRIMVERSLWARNRLPAHLVTGGLPPEALTYGQQDRDDEP
jgi:DTW domain-containing protein YfiP